MRSWVFGSGPECDVVVPSQLASWRHCELTQSADGYLLTDLGSTNGTFVNGTRIMGPTRVSIGDSITLGRTVPFPWPTETTTSLVIGRHDDNDIVLDDPRVSGRHARLVVAAGSRFMIEDLGSSNGTFLNSVENRVAGPTAVSERDTVFFGTMAVPAARLLVQIKKPVTAATPIPLEQPVIATPQPVVAPPPPRAVTAIVELIEQPAVVQPPVADPKFNPWLLCSLIEALVMAALIVVIFGRQAAVPPSSSNWPSIEQGIASVTFALAVAAYCLGGSIAVGESAMGQSMVRPRDRDLAKFIASFGTRLAILVSLCAVGCVLTLTIVYVGSGLKGPWLSMYVMMLLASLVALFLGLVVAAFSPNWSTAALVFLTLLVPLIALGGKFWPLPAMPVPVRWLAATTPSRWAFEGLFLLETTENQAPPALDYMDKLKSHDLKEGLFPAESEQMGARADAMALGSMLIGLAAVALFLSMRSE